MSAMPCTRTILEQETVGDHFDRLFRTAWALCGSREDAEDLVQDTYARVLARPRRVCRGNDLGYLLSALRNTFFSGRRAVRRRPQRARVEIEALALRDPHAGAEPENAAEANEVFGVIAGLPADRRNALTAVDVAGLSYSEAATLLHVREATIATRLFRARKQVARAL
jgi:RNA polymerase sigma-70 factor (ECF subfamily)